MEEVLKHIGWLSEKVLQSPFKRIIFGVLQRIANQREGTPEAKRCL